MMPPSSSDLEDISSRNKLEKSVMCLNSTSRQEPYRWSAAVLSDSQLATSSSQLATSVARNLPGLILKG